MSLRLNYLRTAITRIPNITTGNEGKTPCQPRSGFAGFDESKEDWLLYTERMQQYFVTNGAREDRQRATLLSTCGPATYPQTTVNKLQLWICFGRHATGSTSLWVAGCGTTEEGIVRERPYLPMCLIHMAGP